MIGDFVSEIGDSDGYSILMWRVDFESFPVFGDDEYDSFSSSCYTCPFSIFLRVVLIGEADITLPLPDMCCLLLMVKSSMLRCES